MGVVSRPFNRIAMPKNPFSLLLVENLLLSLKSIRSWKRCSSVLGRRSQSCWIRAEPSRRGGVSSWSFRLSFSRLSFGTTQWSPLESIRSWKRCSRVLSQGSQSFWIRAEPSWQRGVRFDSSDWILVDWALESHSDGNKILTRDSCRGVAGWASFKFPSTRKFGRVNGISAFQILKN